MIIGEDHPQLEMLVNRLLVDGLYLLETTMVDLSTKVVMGLWEVVIMVHQKVVVVDT
jgi:hypothetical protein